MGWLARIRREADQGARELDEGEGAEAPAAVERASPGLAALFEGMKPEGGHSILDLGEGSNRQMEALAPYARIIRFVGLVPGSEGGGAPDPAALPSHPEYPYDIVLGWNVLDGLQSEGRAALMRRLGEITARGARLYASVLADATRTFQPIRATLVAPGRVEEEPVGPERPAGPQLLPAQVEKLLSPWVVSHAYSLRTGRKEYVARRDA